jgi:pyruvate dehydrogenase phosphatase
MVSTSLMKIVSPCWKPSVEGENSSNRGDASGRVDGLLWYKDSGQHVNGDFSMAVIQANHLLEDHSQLESGSMSSLESGPHGTFVGVYDGHGGPEAARFINDHLFNNIKSKLLFHITHHPSLCNLLLCQLDGYFICGQFLLCKCG